MTTRDFGLLGESCAAEYLKSRGYEIKNRNVRVGHDEIDIIAQYGEYLIFAEVKTRRQIPDSSVPFGTPASAVNEEKQKNMIRALEGYLASNATDLQPRIDVIEVYVSPSDGKPSSTYVTTRTLFKSVASSRGIREKNDFWHDLDENLGENEAV